MTSLDEIKGWLMGFPQWGQATFYIDYTDAQPGNSGLFSGGLEELERREDILGNVTLKNRCSFTLRRVTYGQQSNEAEAQWLQSFQAWVQRQSVQGLAPGMGDNTANVRWKAERGHLKEASQAGTGTYVVNLTVEYTENL